MATQLKEDFTEATRSRRRPRPTFAWVAQVTSGVLLLVLLTVHMVAQHFVVEGGLRTYADVVAWIRNPVVFAVEALLLICVTWHGIAGVHAVLLDLGLGLRGRAERIVARVLLDLAVATVLYGLWLLYTIAFGG
jgi:succinate dehydrogenase hydrophobic anchor subunit